jgi:hypothetical protein
MEIRFDKTGQEMHENGAGGPRAAAFTIAAQLPEDQDEALAVLKVAESLVRLTASAAGRAALQLAAQLPDSQDDALAALGIAERLVRFAAGPGGFLGSDQDQERVLAFPGARGSPSTSFRAS